MKLPVIFLAAALLSPTVLAAAPKPDRIPIFIRSAADVDGFTDPSQARRDSLKDLVKQIRGSDIVAQVDTEAEAVAVLEVLDRSTHRETNWNTALGGWRQNISVLTVRLTVGEYSTEFEGQSKSKGVLTGYGQAANRVVKQLEKWVIANREKLRATR